MNDNDFRKEIKKVVMEVLKGTQETSLSGRELFWKPLAGVFSTWIYMLGKAPVGSVWLDATSGLWHYSIPVLKKTGYEQFQIDAFHCVSSYLAESESDFLQALG